MPGMGPIADGGVMPLREEAEVPAAEDWRKGTRPEKGENGLVTTRSCRACSWTCPSVIVTDKERLPRWRASVAGSASRTNGRASSSRSERSAVRNESDAWRTRLVAA